MTAYSRTVSFKTGRVPGRPQTTGSICVLGSSPKAVDADVNILLLVLSCTWVSKPITASQDSNFFIIKCSFLNIIGYKVKEDQNISKL